MDLLKGELNNGVFRRSSSSFLAHYLIICDESNKLESEDFCNR